MFPKYFSPWHLFLTMENGAQSKQTNKKNQHTMVSSVVKHKALWVKYKKITLSSISSELLQNTQSFLSKQPKFSMITAKKAELLEG